MYNVYKNEIQKQNRQGPQGVLMTCDMGRRCFITYNCRSSFISTVYEICKNKGDKGDNTFYEGH